MEYVKENPIIDKNDSEKNHQLIESILITKEDLNKAHNNFEYAEGDLVDFYIYQIMALQAKFDYLTKLAKTKNIDFNFVYKNVV